VSARILSSKGRIKEEESCQKGKEAESLRALRGEADEENDDEGKGKKGQGSKADVHVAR